MTAPELRALMEEAGADVASLAFRLNVKPAFLKGLVDGAENIDSDRATRIRATLLLSIRSREAGKLAAAAKRDRKERLEQWLADVQTAAAEHLANGGHPLGLLLAKVRLTLDRIEARLDKLEQPVVTMSAPITPEPLLIGVDGVRRLLDCTTSHVRELVAAGKLRPVWVGASRKPSAQRFYRLDVYAVQLDPAAASSAALQPEASPAT